MLNTSANNYFFIHSTLHIFNTQIGIKSIKRNEYIFYKMIATTNTD